jgi:hypothetical protein
VVTRVAQWDLSGKGHAIALDYRVDVSNPRVVASHWHAGTAYEWAEIAEEFEALARMLGLMPG